MKNFILKHRYCILLSFFIFIYIIYFSYFSIKRYQTLNSHYYDLGIMNQVVYNTSRGRILEMTNPTFLKNMSRLVIHFDPILIFFAPLYLIFNSPAVLLVGQSLILALGGLAVYKFSYLIFKKRKISFLFFLFYLLNYQIARSLLFDFHPIVLAIPILLLAIYFYHLKKIKLYYIFIFLSLLTKEHVGLFLIFLGVFYFFFLKDKKNGLLTFLIGFLSFLIINIFVIPYFRSEAHFALKYYSKNEILNLISNERFNYLKRLYLPFLFSFFSPAIILSLPELVVNYISSNHNMRSVYFHYQSLILVGLFYSSILGYKNFERKVKSRLLKLFFYFLFFIFNIYYFYKFYPLPYFVKEKINFSPVSPGTIQAISFWKKTLKNEEIKIATTPKLAPFFSSRIFYINFLFDPAYYSLGYTDEDIFQIKKDVYKNADYIIIYKKEIGAILQKNATTKLYNNLLKDQNYQLIFNEAQIEVFKKIQ